MVAGALAPAVVLAALALAGCGEEDAPPVDPGVVTPTTLHYDGGNLSAPFLAAGAYEAGARFTAAQIGTRVGRKLTAVQYYISSPAEVCSVKVYGPATATEPGARLYAAEVTDDVRADRWNSHTLAQPVTLAAADVWICLEFSNTVGQSTLGCDPGPAVMDGDWLYTVSDDIWKPLSQRFPVSINWNIRGMVE
jgi:hypothetical protein